MRSRAITYCTRLRVLDKCILLRLHVVTRYYYPPIKLDQPNKITQSFTTSWKDVNAEYYKMYYRIRPIFFRKTCTINLKC